MQNLPQKAFCDKIYHCLLSPFLPLIVSCHGSSHTTLTKPTCDYPPHNASGVTRAIVLSPPTNPPTQTPSYSTHFPFTPQHFSTLVINLGPNNPLLPLQQHPNNQTTQPINHSFIHSNLCTDTTLIVPTQFTVSGPYLARPCSTILYLNHHHHQTSLFIHFFPSLTSFSILSFFPSHISASAQCSDPM
jgi:hypothetical protein